MFSFYYGCDNVYINVTSKIKDLFSGNKLNFAHSYNDFFDDPMHGKRKHLRVESQVLPTFNIKEDFPFTLTLNPKKTAIKVVYFINTFCAPEDYYFLMKEQLQGLVECGLDKHEVYVEVSGDNGRIAKEIKDIIPTASVTFHDNSHEYPGLLRVWKLAQEEEESFILYFHSKGITRLKNKKERDPIERLLYKDLIEEWRVCVKFLMFFPSLNKIGRFISGPGWSWHNFFWVRSSYVKQCEKPVKTTRRHYYEDWLARKKRGTWEENETEKHLNAGNYEISGKDFLSTCCLPGDLDSGHQMRRIDPHGTICHMGESYQP